MTVTVLRESFAPFPKRYFVSTFKSAKISQGNAEISTIL